MSSPDQEKSISPAQYRAIESLLTQGKHKKAAADAGVSVRTLQRWFDDPAFMAMLRHAEAAAVAGLSRRLAALGDSAMEALSDALAPYNKIGTRLRAAQIVIDNLIRLRELVDIETRLSQLEKGMVADEGY